MPTFTALKTTGVTTN